MTKIESHAFEIIEVREVVRDEVDAFSDGELLNHNFDNKVI